MKKSKWIEGLDCDATARAGVAFVLRAKLERMCALRDAALDFSDIEGVHKMRVASRRLRSALRDFQPYLAEKVSSKRLKAVARALGAVRDEDVAIEMVEKLIAEADEEAREGIARIAGGRRARREEARAALTAAVSDAALGELRETFNAQLDEAAAETAANGGRRRPGRTTRFSHVGGDIVRARFEELRESGRSLYEPFEVEPLHEMRIRAKRLRYAIELFTQCWGESVEPYASEIAKLQEHLGELHDCDVWAADLGARLAKGGGAKKARRRQTTADAERRAAVWLMSHFARERAEHYGKALALWDSWEVMGFGSSLMASVREARSRPQPPPAPEAEPAAKAD
ncbi:MAG TPA: CHAD domain-containing protein [Pyrinomonadaceae bacterium]|nr:CHAD domain-containing protein [Pyrinomonadaceae bacterium]